MSSTKIVIIVLVLVVVIFVIFVARGAFRSEPKSKNSNESANEFTENPPAWTKSIKRLIGSRQPKLTLKEDSYTSLAEEKIPPDNENQFRTAKFKLKHGRPVIEYEDNTENLNEDMKDLKEQSCSFKDFNKDKNRECSIVALKGGGTFRFRCEKDPCSVEVVK